MSTTLLAILVGLFVVVILTLLTWGLYNYHMLQSRAANVAQNPYCVREVCATGDADITDVYTLTTEDDPIRIGYESLSYCVINAVPCKMLEAMKTCGDDVAKEDLVNLAKFYDDEYYDRCSYNWGAGIHVGTGGPDVNPTNDPNSKEMRCGPNDPALSALLSCAGTLGLDDNDDIKSLKSKIASVCSAETAMFI